MVCTCVCVLRAPLKSFLRSPARRRRHTHTHTPSRADAQFPHMRPHALLADRHFQFARVRSPHQRLHTRERGVRLSDGGPTNIAVTARARSAHQRNVYMYAHMNACAFGVRAPANFRFFVRVFRLAGGGWIFELCYSQLGATGQEEIVPGVTHTHIRTRTAAR